MGAAHKAIDESHRFSIGRRLGSGGFGVVYEAVDLRYGATVALKFLYQDDPAALLRFKQEFRVLADITHANLVLLHELVSEQGHWLLSMEFVEGKHLLEGLGIAPPDAATTTLVMTQPAWALPTETQPDRTATPVLDIARLRAAFVDLVQGVRALHAANVLHLDLKPSNVLLTPTGRVVILDFGLAQELLPVHPDSFATIAENLVGTPAYIAPELLRGQTATEASDWYSVGVILYEALSGHLPFEGNKDQVLRGKLFAPPIPPSLLAEHVPEDLELLCLALLRRDPKARPTEDEIERCLRSANLSIAIIHHPPEEKRPRQRLLGREREMEALFTAFRETSAGHPVLVRLSGDSGVGKSALASTFLSALHDVEGASVLWGRCYDRESVPYKALDSLVDSLVRHVKGLPTALARALIPPNFQDLERIFPVFGILDDSSADEAREETLDPIRARIRAFRALKELLRRLAMHKPFALCIDDLHWGDVDSAQLLFELLSPPEAPPLIFVACYRSGEIEESTFVRQFERLLSSSKPCICIRDIRVAPLDYAQTLHLAIDCLGPPAKMETAEAIAQESKGNPFSVEELARYIHATKGAAQGTETCGSPRGSILDQAIHERLAATPELPRRLLEIVAVAGHPIEQHIAFAAAELDESALACLTSLRSVGQLKVCSVHDRPGCEVVHDRLRTAVLSEIGSEALAARHHHLATALETADGVEPEELAMHFHSAGEMYKAARYAAAAGERASAALAFDHAAELYALALDWARGGPNDTPTERQALNVRRANALAHAGRCREAAALYLKCSENAQPDESLELRRCAIEQYFVGGYLDDGNRVLASFLAEQGLHLPKTTATAVMAVFLDLRQIRRRGYAFKPRPAADVDSALLARIDVCMAVSMALTDVDPLRSCVFLLRGLDLALHAGEQSRIALALGSYAQLSLLQGTPSAVDEGMRLLRQAEEIAKHCTDSNVRNTVHIYGASRLFIEGRWSAALEQYDAIGHELRRRRERLALYHNMAHVIAVIALDAMGRFSELTERTTTWHRDASSVGNLFAATSAAIASAVPLIAADDVDEARRRVRSTLASWTHPGMHVQHMYALRVEAYADLYQGNADGARARVMHAWRSIALSQQLRVQPARIDMLFLRARTAIACAAKHSGRIRRMRLLREAERIATRLEAEIRSDARPDAALLRAAIAHLRGQKYHALECLDSAIAGFEAADMELCAACARRRRGELAGGDDGRAMIAVADAVMQQRGVCRPERWAAIFAPGFRI